MKLLNYAFLVLLAQGPLAAQTLLFDDFNDATVNPGLWSVDLPFPESRIEEAGGLLTTFSRGTLATADGFSGGVVVSGIFTLNHQVENFEVLLRTDLVQFNEFWERMGVYVDFHNALDVQGQGVPGLAIGEHTPSGERTLASSAFTLAYGRPYQFTITDTGSGVALAIDGEERLFAATTYAAGDRIAFFSREFPDTSTSLDYVSIDVVPEPAVSLLAGLAALGLTLRSGLRQWRKSRALSIRRS